MDEKSGSLSHKEYRNQELSHSNVSRDSGEREGSFVREQLEQVLVPSDGGVLL